MEECLSTLFREGARISVHLGHICHLLSLLDNMEASLRQNMGQTEGKVINFVLISYRESIFNPLDITCLF